METTLKSGNSNYCQVAVQEVLFSAIIIRKTNTPLPFETPNIGESSSQQQGDPEHKEIPEISESERTQRADEHHQQEHEDRDRDIREADRVLDRGQMIAEAEERLNTIIDSEEAQIKAIEDARRSAGAFGKFHRWLTKSDPYELDIKTCRNTIGAATHGKNLLREAQAETNTNAQADLINQARILSGLGEMNATNFDNPVGMRQVRAGDRAFHEQLLKDEQEAITVSRDVAVSTITTAGTLGGGAAVNVLGKGGHMAATTTLAAMRSGAVIGGTIAAAESTAHNIDDVQRGEKDIKEATTDIAKDTMVGAALGAGLGAAGKKLEKPLKKAGNKFKKLWNRMRGKSIPEPPPPPPLKQVKPPSERKSPEQSPPQQPAQSPQTASPTDIKAEHKAPSVTPKPKAAPSVPSVWKQGDRIQGRALRAADGEELPPLDYKVVGRKTGDPSKMIVEAESGVKAGQRFELNITDQNRVPKPPRAPAPRSIWKEGDRIQGKTIQSADGKILPATRDYEVIGIRGDPSKVLLEIKNGNQPGTLIEVNVTDLNKIPKPKAAPSVPSVWKQGDRIQGRALRAADGEELPPLDYKVVGRKTGDPSKMIVEAESGDPAHKGQWFEVNVADMNRMPKPPLAPQPLQPHTAETPEAPLSAMAVSPVVVTEEMPAVNLSPKPAARPSPINETKADTILRETHGALEHDDNTEETV